MLSWLGIPGIIFGHISPPIHSGGLPTTIRRPRICLLAGLLTGYLSILITLAFTLPALSESQRTGSQALTCANNLKQIISRVQGLAER